MRKIIQILVLILCYQTGNTQLDFRGQQYVNDIETKRKRLMFLADSVSPNGKFIFNYAEAFFYASQNYAKNTSDSLRLDRLGKNLFKKGLDDIYARRIDDTTFNETGFTSWPLMQCFTRYKKNVYTADTSRVRYFALYNDFSVGSTANLTFMGAVAAYFAAQNFGVNNMKNGYSTTDKSGIKLITPRLDGIVFSEIPEITSAPYSRENTDPLLTLALLSNDSTLRRKSLICFETILSEYAVCWLNGFLSKSSTRTYPHNAANGQVGWGVWGYLWYFFSGGGNRFVDSVGYTYQKGSEFSQLSAAVQAGYILPEIIYQTANDRTNAYTVFNNNWEGNRSSTFLTYINKYYTLHTATVRIGGTNYWKTGIGWTITDSANFFARSDNNNFWITKPTDDTVIHNGAYNCDDGENASLYENTWYALYNTNYHNATSIYYALGYVPGGYKKIINESNTKNRIYLYYANMLLAVSSSVPFNWNPTTPTLVKSPHADNSEFRIFDSTNCFGLIIETAAPQDFQGANDSLTLLNFKNKITTQPLPKVTGKALNVDARPRLEYTDYKGNKIIMNFRKTFDWQTSTDTVNGVWQDYFSAPRIKSPFINRAKTFSVNNNGSAAFDNTKPMIIQYAQCTRVYDYNNWNASTVCKNTQPFQFISFTGNKDSATIKLNWSVIAEDSIVYYEIQRSNDEFNFTTIKRNNKNAYFSLYSDYIFIDSTADLKSPLSYKIAAYKADGSKMYSVLVIINPQTNQFNQLLLFPNPSSVKTNYINAKFWTNNSDIITYTVFTNTGVKLIEGKYTLALGSNIFKIQLQQILSAGTYYIVWNTQNGFKGTQTFIRF
jgi:hypothetical protein